MTPTQLVQVLQLTDSFFPVGAFAYSDGLESAATGGLVHDGDSLAEWMDHFLNSVFVPCDGLALVNCMGAIERGNLAELHRIDEELTAIKPAAAVRAASSSMGKRLLTALQVPHLPHCNAPAAYALAFSHRGITKRDAVLAFGYNRLTGIVSAGLRLISLGQQQGQALLTRTLEGLPAAADLILQTEGEPLRNFSPLVDIRQMNHRYAYSRLFRS